MAARDCFGGCVYFRFTILAFPCNLLSGISCFAVIIVFLAVILTENKQRVTAIILTALLTGARVYVASRAEVSSAGFPLPETVIGAEVAEVLISDPDNVSVNMEQLKENHMKVSVHKPGACEIRLIGADWHELALYDVNAFYEEGNLMVECKLRESE